MSAAEEAGGSPVEKPGSPKSGGSGGAAAAAAAPKPKPGGKGGRAPGNGTDLWAMIQGQQASTQEQQDQQEVTMIVVGSQGAGKSSLIQMFVRRENANLRKEPAAVIKPTTALEYNFIPREESNKVAHFYELGGSQQLAPMLDIVITQENISTIAVMVVVDLSKPHTVFDTITFWMLKIKKRIGDIFGQMNSKKDSSSTPTKMLARTAARFGENHPDIKTAQSKGMVCGVPIMFVANKYDVFHKKTETEAAKIMAKTLRWLAHSNAASLVYMPSASGLNQSTDPIEVQRFSALTANIAFSGAPMTQATSQVQDISRSIFVVLGHDTFSDIGKPAEAAQKPADFVSTGNPDTDKWKIYFEYAFKGSKDDDSSGLGGLDVDNEEYAEETVDKMRETKRDEIQSTKDERLQKARAAASKKPEPKRAVG